MRVIAARLLSSCSIRINTTLFISITVTVLLRWSFRKLKKSPSSKCLNSTTPNAAQVASAAPEKGHSDRFGNVLCYPILLYSTPFYRGCSRCEMWSLSIYLDSFVDIFVRTMSEKKFGLIQHSERKTQGRCERL